MKAENIVKGLIGLTILVGSEILVSACCGAYVWNNVIATMFIGLPYLTTRQTFALMVSCRLLTGLRGKVEETDSEKFVNDVIMRCGAKLFATLVIKICIGL